MTDDESTARFDAYVALYNNLDNLLWRIPGFLIAGAAILIGFSGTVLAKDSVANVSPVLFAGVSLLVSLLFFLSGVSMARIREHHTIAGNWLAKMEEDGYFHDRLVTVRRRWPPSAPDVFKWTYYSLAFLFLFIAIMAIARFSWLVALIDCQAA